ncbi:hypothetical protein HaLaN_16936 [Haematococcus lacustris]|uniref:Uncharacterized protein n=1 Tax=Haematococcus lacustris TaxID=44745 RepID=A0A699ZLU4_HAELA|nr:hypothetical protein HaLaN_16936 [Haematococcus lacustris]
MKISCSQQPHWRERARRPPLLQQGFASQVAEASKRLRPASIAVELPADLSAPMRTAARILSPVLSELGHPRFLAIPDLRALQRLTTQQQRQHMAGQLAACQLDKLHELRLFGWVEGMDLMMALHLESEGVAVHCIDLPVADQESNQGPGSGSRGVMTRVTPALKAGEADNGGTPCSHASHVSGGHGRGRGVPDNEVSVGGSSGGCTLGTVGGEAGGRGLGVHHTAERASAERGQEGMAATQARLQHNMAWLSRSRLRVSDAVQQQARWAGTAWERIVGGVNRGLVSAEEFAGEGVAHGAASHAAASPSAGGGGGCTCAWAAAGAAQAGWAGAQGAHVSAAVTHDDNPGTTLCCQGVQAWPLLVVRALRPSTLTRVLKAWVRVRDDDGGTPNFAEWDL